MTGYKAPRELGGDQYYAIEDALLSSEAGRAFLRMRDRRSAAVASDEHRTALESIRQWIETAMKQSVEEAHLEVLRRELMEMASSIRKAKTEIRAIKPADDGGEGGNGGSSRRINLATEELDAIVQATERATTDILNSAEHIIEIAARVREAGQDRDADQLDNEATGILMACGFQDITGQRISKVVSTLRYLEERVDAMIRIWGIEGGGDEPSPTATGDARPDAHLLNGPALHGGVDQVMVDALLNGSFMEESGGWPEDDMAAAMAAEPVGEPVVEPPPPAGAALDQSSIDSLFD